MKKYKKILYIFLLFVIIILASFLYSTISKGNIENEKEKALSEIEYLEKKIVTLLNKINNIETRNYSLSVSETSEENSNETKNESSEDSTNGKNTTGQKTEDNSQEEQSSNNEQNEEYTLNKDGVLINTNDIDWKSIKAEIENLYLTIPTVTIDLYSMEIEREYVLGFNQELDNLTKSVEEENKENTLQSLSKMYEYISQFINKVSENTTTKVIIETKKNLFKAYSKLDSKNWEEISNDVKETINIYSEQLVNIGSNDIEQYEANKIYVMLNELLNAVNIQDESIFLIKYKNILEEMNRL